MWDLGRGRECKKELLGEGARGRRGIRKSIYPYAQI
jgi:hypothetical protein